MRRDRKLNSFEQKDLARRKYAERQLQKFIDWSVESKGYLKYKDLIKYSEKYGANKNHIAEQKELKLKEKVYMLRLRHLALHLAHYIKRNTTDKEDERKYIIRNAK